jgi:hypothetical protein
MKLPPALKQALLPASGSFVKNEERLMYLPSKAKF